MPDPILVDAAELAALRALAATVLPWVDGLTGAQPVIDTARQYRPVLDPRDPGIRLAWPEQDREPVAGVDYLPADDQWGYRRDDQPAAGRVNHHAIGYSADVPANCRPAAVEPVSHEYDTYTLPTPARAA
jgi:hypothetical protein